MVVVRALGGFLREKETAAKINDGVKLAEGSGQAMSGIIDCSRRFSEMVDELVTAMEQQITAIQELVARFKQEEAA